MATETDEGKGQRIGSHIRLSGKAFGIPIFLDEIHEKQVALDVTFSMSKKLSCKCMVPVGRRQSFPFPQDGYDCLKVFGCHQR